MGQISWVESEWSGYAESSCCRMMSFWVDIGRFKYFSHGTT